MSASTLTLRLPASIKAAVERLARDDGVSTNQFVAKAVAEKLAAMKTAEFFAERRSAAGLCAMRWLLRRKGGESPREDDERV